MKLEKIGIARLKMLMAAVLSLSAIIQKQLADGAQITDLFALVTAWPNITVIINEAKGAWVEFKDLDARMQMGIWGQLQQQSQQQEQPGM